MGTAEVGLKSINLGLQLSFRSFLCVGPLRRVRVLLNVGNLSNTEKQIPREVWILRRETKCIYGKSTALATPVTAIELPTSSNQRGSPNVI